MMPLTSVKTYVLYIYYSNVQILLRVMSYITFISVTVWPRRRRRATIAAV